MKYSREIKVGAAIIFAVLAFVLGVRFFEDIPIFRGTYELNTTFNAAEGLLNGNAVRINGVDIGAVESVKLDPETHQVQVRFHIDSKIKVPQGSFASVDGIAALGNVYVRLELAQDMGNYVEEGGFVPGQTEGGLAGLLSQAPQYAARADSLLITAQIAMAEAAATFRSANQLVSASSNDLRLTLAGVRGAAHTLEALLGSQQGRLTNVIGNFETASGDLSAFTTENRDSLALAVRNMNTLLRRLDGNLGSFESSVSRVDTLLVGVERGEGNLGLLLRDTTLYGRVDSLTINLNKIMDDFRKNPGRYLRHVDIIDVF